MNLKLQKVDWEKDLMYVEFEADGQRFRWYPKWREVDDILHCAWLTEGAFNNSRWGDFFEVICSEILLKTLVHKVSRNRGVKNFPTMEVELTGIFKRLKEVASSEGDNATP